MDSVEITVHNRDTDGYVILPEVTDASEEDRNAWQSLSISSSESISDMSLGKQLDLPFCFLGTKCVLDSEARRQDALTDLLFPIHKVFNCPKYSGIQYRAVTVGLGSQPEVLVHDGCALEFNLSVIAILGNVNPF